AALPLPWREESDVSEKDLLGTIPQDQKCVPRGVTPGVVGPFADRRWDAEQRQELLDALQQRRLTERTWMPAPDPTQPSPSKYPRRNAPTMSAGAWNRLGGTRRAPDFPPAPSCSKAPAMSTPETSSTGQVRVRR